MIATLIAVATFAVGLPQNPDHYISDLHHHLTPTQEQALSGILIEHDRMAGDQLQLALLDQAQKSPKEDTQEIFNQWDCGKRAGGNGALISLFFEEKKTEIELGYGISTRIHEDALQKILKSATNPDQTFSSLGQALLTALTFLESPLIQNGRALAILTEAGWTPPQSSSNWMSWALVAFTLLAGILLAIWGLRRKTLQGIQISRRGIEPPDFQHAYGMDCELLLQTIRDLEIRSRCEIALQISRMGFRKKKSSAQFDPSTPSLLIQVHLRKKSVHVDLSPALAQNYGTNWVASYCDEFQRKFEFTHPQRALLQGLDQLESILLRKETSR